MSEIKKITSFTVDHTKIVPGLYISRRDGSITTYDMRTRRPNCGDYMSNVTMHSTEHMFATYIRNSDIGENVIYFGPMGCQTGFYLLVDGVDDARVKEEIIKVLRLIIAHDGAMFGESEVECGNFRSLSLDEAKAECRRYLDVLTSGDGGFEYPA